MTDSSTDDKEKKRFPEIEQAELSSTVFRFKPLASLFLSLLSVLSVLLTIKVFACCADFASAYPACCNCLVFALRAVSNAATLLLPFAVS